MGSRIARIYVVECDQSCRGAVKFTDSCKCCRQVCWVWCCIINVSMVLFISFFKNFSRSNVLTFVFLYSSVMMPEKQKKSQSPSTNTNVPYSTVMLTQLPPMLMAMEEDGSHPELQAAIPALKHRTNAINEAYPIECCGIEWFWWMAWAGRAYWPSLVLLVLKQLWLPMLCQSTIFEWIRLHYISLLFH